MNRDIRPLGAGDGRDTNGALGRAEADLERRRRDAPDPAPEPEPPAHPATRHLFEDQD